MLDDDSGTENSSFSHKGCTTTSFVAGIDDDRSNISLAGDSVPGLVPHMSHDIFAQHDAHFTSSMVNGDIVKGAIGAESYKNGNGTACIKETCDLGAVASPLRQDVASNEAGSMDEQRPSAVSSEFDRQGVVAASPHVSVEASMNDTDDKKCGEYHQSNEATASSTLVNNECFDRESQLEEFLKSIPGSQENLQRFVRNLSVPTGLNRPPSSDAVTVTSDLSKVMDGFVHDGRVNKENPLMDSLNTNSTRLCLKSCTLGPPLSSESSNVLQSAKRFDPVLSHTMCSVSGEDLGASSCMHSTLTNFHQHDYSAHFDENKDVVERLHLMFSSCDAVDIGGDTDALFQEYKHMEYGRGSDVLHPNFEWFPNEPSTEDTALKEIHDIANLFDESSVPSQKEVSNDLLMATNMDDENAIAESHLRMLRHIHESLYTTSDVSSLRTLEKFMVDLLQPDSDYGSLTPHGRLLAFINLSSLRRHMFQLSALYKHPEMSVIRDVLQHNEEGSIRRVLGISEAMANGQLSEEAGNAAIKELMDRIDRTSKLYDTVSVRSSSKQQSTDSPPVGGKGRAPISPGLLNVKSNRQLLLMLDELSALYKTGGEAHFPRFVCGSIDRMRAQMMETLSIPFDKADRRNIHVQFESYDRHGDSWPVLTHIPHTIGGGIRVHVNSSRQPTASCWTLGTVISVSAGMVMISVDGSCLVDSSRASGDGVARGSSTERMFMMRNFVPPNVPSTRIEKAQWRILPRHIDLDRDIYVGSCLSVFDSSMGGYVDMVVLNVLYGDDGRGGIAPVKSPMDEIIILPTSGAAETFETANTVDLRCALANSHSDDGSEKNRLHHSPVANDLEPTHTCHCIGHSLRVFEGRCLRCRPKHVVLSPLSERKEVLVEICNVKGYKLNYDLQAHFDIHMEPSNSASSNQNSGVSYCHFQHCLWVVPRHVRRDEMQVEDGLPDKIGSQWLFEPERCLIMFPYNRNIDFLQDSTRLISFLHPELNYAALCIGIWNVRSSGKNGNEADHISSESTSAADGSTLRSETVSCTRSQKAATRELKLSDIVIEACSNVVRSPISLVRRLLGCHSIISLWMALDGFELDNVDSSKLTLSAKLPSKPNCSSCGGAVYAYEDIVKSVPLISDDGCEKNIDSNDNVPAPTTGKDAQTFDVPTFRNLETTEEIIQRLQSLVTCRWRLTREYTASYTVDDELIPTTRSYHHGHVSPQLRCNFGKSTFINKFMELMSYVKRSRDTYVDDRLYKRAFQWSNRYFNTRGIEATLMRGWGAFLMSKKPLSVPLLSTKLLNDFYTAEPLHERNTMKPSEWKVPVSDGNIAMLPQVQLNVEVCAETGTHKRAGSTNTGQEMISGRKRKVADRKDSPCKNRSNGKPLEDAAVSGRVSSSDKKTQRSKKPRMTRVAENEYCEFKDKEIRFKYVSVVKWDEDLESSSFTM
ncbi:hypothetical protein X943_003144 [Babesia divergens]|uniref:Uncharacterized protein n=1 Tax=Babesia divergens TaxID=32595 RepID=A0AAD9LGY0_BABDI|nr:hypothetical protein X943_003144 [Babesia divergens]